MIRLLLTRFKKILMLLLIAFMVNTSMSFANSSDVVRVRFTDDFVNIKVVESVEPVASIEPIETIAVQQRQCEVIIRAGEYEGKAGKRIYINNTTVNLPDDIPVRNDGDGKGFYISEWDINVKEAKAIVEKLQAKGVNAKLQIAHSKSEDLNAAGRIANKSNPKLYVSVHHNYYDANSTGYFAMYNPNNQKSKEAADRLSNAINNNSQVPQRACRENTGYIGELNVINSSTVPVLLELGFFSNVNELEHICSNSYVDYVSTNLANEISLMLNE